MTAKIPPSKVAQIADLRVTGLSYRAIGELVGVSETTAWRWIKRLQRDEEIKVEVVIPTKEIPRRGRNHQLKPCGTNAGYQRHRRKKEKCVICSAAHAEEIRLWKNGQSPSQLRKLYDSDADGVEEKSA